MMRGLLALWIPVLCVHAQVTFLPDGTIEFPAEGSRERLWKPTRWGMYEAVLDAKAAAADLQLGAELLHVRPGAPARFYLAKTDPVKVILPEGSGKIRLLPAPEGAVIRQGKEGQIVLHARDATIHGMTLRYEPNTNKICIGYWVNTNDYPEWTFHLDKPGTYNLSVWQGCGKGQGGSEAVISTAGQELPFTVVETGHFQNFTNLHLGRVSFAKAGEQKLSVKALRKKAGAVMDIRQIMLQPAIIP